VLSRLEAGTLHDGFPPLLDPALLGIGQSMGGCFTILQQDRHRTYEGIGVLGFSAIHTVLPTAPGAPADNPFLPRDDGLPFVTWGFHYDDVPTEVVEADMRGYPTRNGGVPEWGSATIPPCAAQMVEPGCVADEAASIAIPVFVGVGERDVCPDPHAEPSAYRSSGDVTLVVCPRMAHMHNFASTRAAFWERLHLWGEMVAEVSRAR
jgi:pimeloyl-ACP methyl ester carboxylesterase